MTNSDAYEGSARRYRRAAKIGAAILFVVAGVYLTASVTLQAFFGSDFVEGRLNRSLPDSVRKHYRVDVGKVRWSLWQRSMLMGPAGFYAIGDASSTTRSSTSRYTATVSQIELRGLRLWPLFWYGTVSIDEVALQRPILVRETQGRAESGNRLWDDDVNATLRKQVANQLPGTRIGELHVEDGIAVFLDQREGTGNQNATDLLWGLSLRAIGIRPEVSAKDSARLLMSDRVRMSLDGYHHVSEDGLYSTALGPVTASSADSSLVLEGLHIEPTVSDSIFMRRKGHRTNRLLASFRSMNVRGIDYRRFLEDRSVLATSVTLDSLHVDVYRNNRLPPPSPDPPPMMPHEGFRELSQTVRIDAIIVNDGFARYSKLKEEASEPGKIFFDHINATIENVTNDPRRMTSSSPAVIQATTQVAGAGRLTTTIRVPLLSQHLAFDYEGRLGPMDARAFNKAFVPLSGIRIEQGQVDSLWFSASAEHGRARGSLHGIYRDLEVEKVDRSDGERGPRALIKTLVLNKLVVKSDNLRSDPPLRTGTIDHEREPDDTFLKFLWHSVRSGLFSLVGL